MDAVFQEYQEEDEKKAKIGTIIWIISLLLIIIYPWMQFQDPPPGQEGILVQLGIPDVGDGDENTAASSTETSEAEPTESESETPPEETQPDPEPEKPEIKDPPKEKPTPVDDKKVIEDNSKELALKKEKEKKKKEADAKKKKEREEARKKKAAEDAKKKAEEEAKRKKAEAEAKRKAEEAAKKAEAEKLKNELSGLFPGGNGDNGTPGNSGDPGGDPDSGALEGISTGAGKVGGGLAARGGKGPNITDNSQETGRIVMKVCVDGNGKVISAEYTQGGSTSSSARLKKLAKENAFAWNFKGAGVDKQCGTITYDFKVK